MLVHIPSAGVDAIIDDEDGSLVLSHVWHLNKKGYPVTGVVHPEGGSVPWPGRPGQFKKRTTTLRLARLLMGLEWGDLRQVDHINHNPLDHQRSNLEIVTNAGNAQNRLSHRGSSSRYRGVSWFAKSSKWMAVATLDGRQNYLGLFTSEEQAAQVVAEWRAEYMPYSVEGRLRHG